MEFSQVGQTSVPLRTKIEWHIYGAFLFLSFSMQIHFNCYLSTIHMKRQIEEKFSSCKVFFFRKTFDFCTQV